MALASSLLVKLLIAAAAITPAAGYGGYCLYEYCTSSPFEKQMFQQGYRFSPISWDWGTNDTYRENPSKFSEKLEGDWRCTKQLFGNMPLPKTDAASKSETQGLTAPTAPNINENSSETDSIGCLVTVLGNTKDNNKKAAFLKWELALRSGNRGFIYIGDFSAEKTGTNSGDFPHQTTNMIFEAVKGDSGWNIKSGIYWKNIYSNDEDGTEETTDSENPSVKITLLNNKSWSSGNQMCFIKSGEDGDKCGDKEKWEFEKYVGFWEQSENGNKLIDAINIEVKKGSKTHKHDVWSNDEFDSGSSSKDSSGTPMWKGSIDYFYDSNTKEWGRKQSGENMESYLKAIYKPWAGKKGTWTQATQTLCSEVNNNNFTNNTSEAKRKVKFCYQKS